MTQTTFTGNRVPAAVGLSDGRSFAGGFPHEFFAQLRSRDVPYWHEPSEITPDGEGFWVVSRYHDITSVQRNAATFSCDRGGARTAGGTALKDERTAGKLLKQ